MNNIPFQPSQRHVLLQIIFYRNHSFSLKKKIPNKKKKILGGKEGFSLNFCLFSTILMLNRNTNHSDFDSVANNWWFKRWIFWFDDEPKKIWRKNGSDFLLQREFEWNEKILREKNKNWGVFWMREKIWVCWEEE